MIALHLRPVLAAGAGATIVIEVNVPSSLPGGTMLENGARVSGDLPDLTNANGHTINLTAVGAWADLSVTKVQDPAVAHIGEEVEYTITVMNTGSSDAPATFISDTLPLQLADVTWTCTAYPGADCPASGEGDLYHWDHLPAGAQVVYTVRALRATDGEPLVNKVQAVPAAGVDDPHLSNNIAISTNALYRQYLPLVMRNK
jgi:uncharacterized repeat protein (TIGR01451 family)